MDSGSRIFYFPLRFSPDSARRTQRAVYTKCVISRRALLAGGVAAVACGRKKSTGFGGYAFVANEEGQAIAAVDLTAFAVIRHIRLNGDPTEVLSHPGLSSVYALTPRNGTLHEIEIDRLAL